MENRRETRFKGRLGLFLLLGAVVGLGLLVVLREMVMAKFF